MAQPILFVFQITLTAVSYTHLKFEINLAGWGIGCCMLMLFCVPILGNTLGNETTYSEVLLDGEVIGAVADPEEVDQAF